MTTVTAVPIRPVKPRVLIVLWIGVALAVIVAAALAWQAPRDTAADFLAKNARVAGVMQTPSGLQYKLLSPGSGTKTPTDDDVALINYQGRLTDGTLFDQSQQPTPLAVTGVVPGFSEALKLMTKGSKYRFWLKPSLGYGDEASGPIPAHSTLVFDVELLDFLPQALIQQMQAQQQMQQGAGGVPGGAMPGGVPAAPGGR